MECFACVGTLKRNSTWDVGDNAYLVENKRKKEKKSGCVITNCITVVLLPWIHSIKMQTFDSVCCDIVENCNIVTVFSTYIWILFALIIKLWWSFHSCPCALKGINGVLQNQNVSVGSCPVPVPLVMLPLLLHASCNNECKAVLGAMHAFSAWLCRLLHTMR